jgi:hypothetical protein
MIKFLKLFVITTIACLWAFSGRSVAQSTWHVDHRGGPGIHFTGLEPAYLAAAPNDRILVHYGDGDSYRLPGFLSKPVRILGQVSPVGLKPIVITGGTEIQVAQNEMMVLHGFELRFDFSTFLARVYDRSSRGVILLSDLDMPACSAGECWFAGNGRAILANVRAEGWSCGFAIAGNVHAWLQNTDISQVSAQYNVYGPLRASENARLRVIGGRYIGGHGSLDCPFPGPPGFIPAAGLDLASFAAHRVLGPNTAIGGIGDFFHPVCGWGSGIGGTRGWRAVGIINCTNLEVIDPLVRLISDTTLNLCPNVPVRELPAVLPGSLRPGHPHLVDVYGTTNSSVSLFVSFLSPAAPIRLPFGEVWLDPSLSLPVRSFPVGTQRHVSVPVNYPPASVHAGDVLVYQAVTMSSGQVLQLSEPGFCVVQ